MKDLYSRKYRLVQKLLLVTLLICTSPISSFGQKDVLKEVCGAKYGSSYKQALLALTKSLGLPDSHSEESIKYCNRNYMGISFDEMIFYFLPKNKYNSNSPRVFNYALFIYACTTREESIRICAQIAQKMGRLFEIETKEKGGMPAYYGGTNPQNDALYAFSILSIEGNDGTFYSALTFWPSMF